MLAIEVHNDEDLDKAIKRFKRDVMKEGILFEAKKREYFVKPSLLKHERTKKLKRKAAIKAKRKKSYLPDFDR